MSMENMNSDFLAAPDTGNVFSGFEAKTPEEKENLNDFLEGFLPSEQGQPAARVSEGATGAPEEVPVNGHQIDAGSIFELLADQLVQPEDQGNLLGLKDQPEESDEQIEEKPKPKATTADLGQPDRPLTLERQARTPWRNRVAELIPRVSTSTIIQIVAGAVAVAASHLGSLYLVGEDPISSTRDAGAQIVDAVNPFN